MRISLSPLIYLVSLVLTADSYLPLHRGLPQTPQVPRHNFRRAPPPATPTHPRRLPPHPRAPTQSPHGIVPGPYQVQGCAGLLGGAGGLAGGEDAGASEEGINWGGRSGAGWGV